MNDKFNVLILGSGGREHTLAWKIAKSTYLNQLYIAPGNGGTFNLAIHTDIDVLNFEQIGLFCIKNKIDIIVVGPEDPLVNGINNYFCADNTLNHIYVFGPESNGAQLEGSKDFSKKFMQRHHIPTAKFKTFTIGQEKEACLFLETMEAPYVLKADGLAAGKGVLIIDNLAEAKNSIIEMLNGKFGAASSKVVIEEFLDGIEVSYFTINDGKNFVLLPEAKDYKRIGDGDKGLNTGGMGAVSPVLFATEEFTKKVISSIIEPTVKGLIADGINYQGFIFFGLINVNGVPKVIEYNCRMGDPETEVVIPRLKSDLLEAIVLCKKQKLSEYIIEIEDYYATTVMAVSKGYPESYKNGKTITLPSILDENQLLFHAGTIKKDKLITNGGRVLACTGLGKNLTKALESSYKLIDVTDFEGINFRRDIGQDLLKLKNEEQH